MLNAEVCDLMGETACGIPDMVVHISVDREYTVDWDQSWVASCDKLPGMGIFLLTSSDQSQQESLLIMAESIIKDKLR